MKTNLFLFIVLLLLIACKETRQEQGENHAEIADEFIDAFYSFNTDSLRSALMDARASQPNILYYQKWAECGNYTIVKRHDCMVKNDSTVICPVTVKDDLMAGLGIDFNVTDTFHITVSQGHVRFVETSSNDPELYYQAKEWVAKNRPEYVEKACEGIWNGGPTPCDCIQGMIKGFREFAVEKK